MENEETNHREPSVRENVLLEAAKAICHFCRDGNPWGAAQTRDGELYEHTEEGVVGVVRPCRASAIHKLRAAK